MTSLRYLSLNSPGATDEGLEELIGLQNLVRLDLEGSSVTPVGLRHLKHFSKLSAVSLSNTQLANADFAPLRGLDKLTHLTLCGPGVTESTLIAAISLPHLKYLRHF